MILLSTAVDDALAGALLSALRLLPVALSSPFLGGPVAPPPVRLGLALALGWAGNQLSGAPPVALDGAVELLAASARELSLGTLLALAATLPVEAARAAGRLTDTLRGATLSELHVAPIRQRESATGDLLAQWCVVVAAWSGGDRLLIHGLLGTFSRLAPGAPFPPPLLGAGGLQLVTELLCSALAIAAPATAGVLAADLAIALIERVSPGVGAANAATPARAALGLCALAIGAAAVGGRLAALVAFAARTPFLSAPGVVP